MKEPLQNICEGKTLQEIVLTLYSAQTGAETIMSLCHITEDELNAILPRSLWLDVKMVPCKKCEGRGYFNVTGPWKRDLQPANHGAVRSEEAGDQKP